MAKTKVGVIGYGVVGKRVADGVVLQPDMELVGVADVAPTSLVAVSADRGFPLFAASETALPGFKDAGLSIAGSLDDLIRESDVVVDCSPPDCRRRTSQGAENWVPSSSAKAERTMT